MNALVKSTIREIKNSIGRYLAILIITALGVGFFAGLRACRPSLTSTAGHYFDVQNLYDYRIMSSVGFSKDSIGAFSNQESVSDAEGALYEDVLITVGEDNLVFRIHSITNRINKLCLVAGRLPEADDECIVDADYFSEDIIGQTLLFADSNSNETLDAFNSSEFTVVGTAKTPLYINGDRGTTSLGDGKIAAFVFVNESCFTADYFKEIYVSLENREMVYSDAYRESISDRKSNVTELAETTAELRNEQIVSDAQKEVDEAQATLDDARTELKAQKDAAIQEVVEHMAGMGLSALPDNPYYVQALEEIDASFAEAENELSEKNVEIANAQQEVDSIEAPTIYVLTRNENAGYTAFEQDSTIIENISVVFPAFFFLVAALVCVTTMTRMVDEQRTQIGVWKAMGYGKVQISCKYLFYAGSAGLIGSVFGFFAGTGCIPMIFWYAYRTMYNFADTLLYAFDPGMYVMSLVTAMLCTAGVTLLCCRNALREVTATILRPKTPKNGKRILLERFSGLWKHISFLHKISLRNVIRYKQRFVLMVLGISGCTALLLTGFGIRDSIQNVTDYQYGEIILFDAEVTFTDSISVEQQEDFFAQHSNAVESVLFLSECNVDLTAGGGTKSVELTSVLSGDIMHFMDLHSADVSVTYPQDGEIILCKGIADKLHIEVGEYVTLTNDSFHQSTLVSAGVFDNYVGNYVFVSENTMAQLCGEAPTNAAYVSFRTDIDPNYAAAAILDDENVSHVALNVNMRETLDTSFSSLNLVVLLIIFYAGVLAFIVLFNLININIGERIREIATIKVLGFFHTESAAYVFREINMLTAAGTLLGLLFGRLLHAFVMEQINPDGICFDSRIVWSSYLFSIVITIVFALLVQLVMRFKLNRISMTESLKAVE